MFGRTEALGLSSEEIVAKVIDGEAIIINLANGYYYSTVGTGAMVWAHIESGQTPDHMIDAVTRHFALDRAIVERDLEAFLGELASEGLIGIAKAGATASSVTGATETPTGNGHVPYAPPSLTKFEDMAHFFALDPPLPELDDPGSTPAER